MDKNSSMISKTKKVNKKLIPAIIQDFETKEVLMLAYMNKKSLEKSIQTGATWFWSRKRDRLWNKGETSGNFQKIKQIKYDCDSDTLLVVVEQIGNACHTGNKSCFYRELNEKKGDLEKLNFTELGSSNKNILNELYRVISKRIKEKAENSYTYSLHEKGLDEVIKKFGEESIEIILSAKHQEKKKVIYEIADLMYHLIVLMVERKITLVEVFEELESRRK